MESTMASEHKFGDRGYDDEIDRLVIGLTRVRSSMEGCSRTLAIMVRSRPIRLLSWTCHQHQHHMRTKTMPPIQYAHEMNAKKRTRKAPRVDGNSSSVFAFDMHKK